MRRVFRVVSALGAGAALVWGLAKSIRRKRNGGESEKGAEWPPKPQPEPVKPAAKAEAKPAKAEPAEAPKAEAKPAPKAEAKPAPEAEAKPAPKAEAKPAPKAEAPKAEAPKAEASAEPLVVKGVVIDDPAKLLAYVNGASEDALQAGGVKGKALAVLLENRPFADAEALGNTAGVGRRTLQTLSNALD
ncbi:MAG: hypothetical protein H6737_12710 [Alphaproteobacteria bacterium]|nr:hypothetical protein [Alphaproteobacteria bacterium]